MLEEAGIGYVLDGNKFLDIEDFERAQHLLDSQLDIQWAEVLSSLVREVFPSMGDILGEEMSYTWTLWQSEWAKDYVFDDPGALPGIMGRLLRHAFITGTADRVLRYMGRPVRAGGQPHWVSDPELMTRIGLWYDGARIRHWLDKNSIKMYNEHNVLRIELTINDPTRFRVYRCVQGSASDVKKLLPMRKGVADIVVRTQVSSARINSFTEHMATLEQDVCVGKLVSEVAKPAFRDGRKARALDVTGKDLAVLEEVADPKYLAGAITNKGLAAALAGTPWAKGLKGRQLSARITRHLCLLRRHGIIKKLPNQHKYMLTPKGRLLGTALCQLLGANICDLANLAA
jgi:hypothetical protein